MFFEQMSSLGTLGPIFLFDDIDNHLVVEIVDILSFETFVRPNKMFFERKVLFSLIDFQSITQTITVTYFVREKKSISDKKKIFFAKEQYFFS